MPWDPWTTGLTSPTLTSYSYRSAALCHLLRYAFLVAALLARLGLPGATIYTDHLNINVTRVINCPTPGRSLYRTGYDSPDYPYLRSPYYIRFLHPGKSSPSCRFGYPRFETTHHLFVECHHFAETRNRSSQDVLAAISVLRREAKANVQTTELHLHIARRLFVDDASALVSAPIAALFGHHPQSNDLPLHHIGACDENRTLMAHSVYLVSSSHLGNI
ncbi:hypothetical protein DFH29DRAFT_1005579 [Suillus ampliporus]|nr:hypothetical protein DFH29DRAFT_1005579 [Suillus ampliporus]